jgi:7-carboxy-7-deazaguanine synthase
MENLYLLTERDQVKFVIGNASDYDFAKNILTALPDGFHGNHVLFSPVFNTLSPAVLSEWILRDRLPVRLHAQLHKIIWPDEERGR